ncbi:MAG: hypothetical protein D6734_00185 [Candidatus Schekmanbacteria bacterium]|nr:MAG: hypothetical protein D6734_00185 [Candidatus Schekmanbacteria bacterium]
MDKNSFEQKIRSLAKENLTDEIRALAKEFPSQEIFDSDFHLSLARIYEELGLSEMMFKEYNLALRDNPKNEEVVLKVSEALVDSGEFEKALKCLNKALKFSPSSKELLDLKGEVLEETNQYEEARIHYEKAFETTSDEKYKHIAEALAKERIDSEDSIETEDDYHFPLPTDEQLLRFVELFSGREGVYARQWASQTGDTGYSVVREPFTFKVAKNHILGNFTVGIYPVRLDNTVNFIAFDIDISSRFIPKFITDRQQWKSAKKVALKTAKSIVNECATSDVFSYIEDSGYKGYHCWIFLKSPLRASIARDFARRIVSSIKADDFLSIEIFPKQKFVKEGSLGNLIKLPFGIHRKTMERGLFVDGEGNPYKDQFAFLFGIESATKSSIYSYIEEKKNIYPLYHPTNKKIVESEEEAGVEEISISEKDSLKGAIYVEEYNIDNDEEFQYIALKCPVIQKIYEKANQTSQLSNDEIIVLSHSVGHLKNGPLAVNAILQKCVNADSSSYLKSRLRGNPISCPKIRTRVPDITSSVDCNCTFEPLLNMYPTPVLHLESLKQKTAGLTSAITFEIIVSEYLKIKKNLQDQEKLMMSYQKKLEEFFSNAGVDSLNTSYGELIKVIEEDGKINFILKM